jgi:hypothetical protein
VPPAVKVAAATANFDIFWLKDEGLEDGANLPDPHIIAAECYGLANFCPLLGGSRRGRVLTPKAFASTAFDICTRQKPFLKTLKSGCVPAPFN